MNSSCDSEGRIFELESENLQLRKDVARFSQLFSREEIDAAENTSASVRHLNHFDHHLLSILDNMPAMIGYWDKNQRNLFGNRAYTSWLGIDPEHMRGKYIAELIGESLYRQNLPYIESVLRGKAQLFERDIPTPDGKQNRRAVVEYISMKRVTTNPVVA
jgi:PAS domain S-box-containing protein